MDKLLDCFLEKASDYCINSLIVEKDNEQLVRYHRFSQEIRFPIFSLSKSVTSLIIGTAVDDGTLSLDEKIIDIFTEYQTIGKNHLVNQVTIRDLLTNTSGTKEALFFMDDPERLVVKNWLAHYFNAEFSYSPGTHFLYSNFSSYILGLVLERKLGKSLLECGKERLFSPLGILSPDWSCDLLGHTHAAFGLQLTASELLKIGKMLLNQGVYKGKQIVSQEYIRQATTNQVLVNPPKYGYGFQFWMNSDGISYRASGKYGQYVIVSPKKNCVIVLQALDEKRVFDVLWQEIYEKL